MTLQQLRELLKSTPEFEQWWENFNKERSKFILTDEELALLSWKASKGETCQ